VFLLVNNGDSACSFHPPTSLKPQITVRETDWQ
jgi:hypothetical protein